jgi:DNA polymerase-1
MAFVVDAPEAAYIGTDDQATRLLERIGNWDMVGLDTETTGLDRMKDQVVFWSLANGEERYTLPRRMLRRFQRFLEDDSVTWAVQNCNFDAAMLANAGIEHVNRRGRPVGNRVDPMVMHCLYKDDDLHHGLDRISKTMLGIGKYASYSELFGKEDIWKIREDHPSFNDMVEYASWDAWLHYLAAEELIRRLKLEETWYGDLWGYYQMIESPLHDVLHGMSRRGVFVDRAYLRPKSAEALMRMEGAVERLCEIAGRPINPGSPKQLQGLFYDELGMPIEQETSGGASGNRKGSTAEDVLISWKERPHIEMQNGKAVKYGRKPKAGVEIKEFPIPAKVKECVDIILEFRKHSKMRGTYIEGVLDRLNEDTGWRIHGDFTQHVARTGRLSSRDPNLQNLPRPENDPYGIRHAYVPTMSEEVDSDWVMLCADYSQLEMMLAASNSDDEAMLAAIHSGKDLHCNTAALMFGIPYEDLKAAKDKKDRRENLTSREKALIQKRTAAKTIGFGVLYGEGPWKLAEQLSVSVGEAKNLQRLFFGAFPDLKDHIDDVEKVCKKEGVAFTVLGRRRRLHNAQNERSWAEKARALRQAFNFTVQGFASEIAKQAMIYLAQDEELRDLDCHMLVQVHDELLFECPPENKERAKELIKLHMERPFGDILKVDLNADVGEGMSWQDSK